MADQTLNRLSEAVADGAPIDWDRVQSLEISDVDRVVVEQLRILAEISTVHRTDEVSESGAETHSTTVPVTPADAVPWGSLLILSELGGGSFGDVYRALDPRLQREVALKVLRRTDHSAQAAHVVAEARLLARVHHPNVVTVHGADVVNGEVGLWMELLHGRTLASWVATDGPLGGQEAALIGAALCRALAAVHQAGLLHRDVKAQNVMREAGGRVVLMDFGAVHDLVDQTTAARPVGTPVYLAPEVLAGRPASVASDVYSLGVLLFFLTTGRYPAMAASIDELRSVHQQGALTELRDLRPDLPAEFVEVVSRALASDPRARYESAGRFEQALLRTVSHSEPEMRAAHDAPAADEHRWRRVLRTAVTGALIVAAALAVAGGWVWLRPAVRSEQIPSIAVLPLRNLSGDASKEYLADSLTDVLITDLTKIAGLRVLSYPAVASFKGQTRTPKEIGGALGVRFLLAGAVAGDGQAIRTTVQLIDTLTGAAVWARDYTRTSAGLLDQQTEIVRTIAAQLQVDLTPKAVARLQQRVVPADAEDYYLRGIAESYRSQMATPTSAVELLERAVAIDPAFAEAWASLAIERIRFANQSPGPDKEALYARGRTEARTAIDLNPSLGDAHIALADIRFYQDWDWSGAEDSYRTAVDLAPGSAYAHGRYAMFLAAAGRTAEAITMGHAAQAIEPQTAVNSSNLATIYHYARRYSDAIREGQRALDLQSGYPIANFRLCSIYASLGRFDEGAERCQDAIAGGNRLSARFELARVHALAGRRDEAERVLNDVLTLPQGPYTNPEHLAFVHAALGETDAAFMRLEEAFAKRAPNLLWIRVDARFDPLRGDARFASLVERVIRGNR